ncbi:shikimate dehydrogenase [Flavobacterium akiainvivens]|uniref:Shikimate dehydrogenase n=1 Tax=Flavobacterium akiainvivens TaxID=1202724 RepID=A0A0M8MD39_9FLAO|nr:shikimate dehydrogenase [Flavobacterium akiainvivens]KOS06294.1 shikimate dehydrogenase [Flavobacterium akiainvivens]SFQ17008.1 shikimate dehydrogenase [Flavobacterium akiainvivens]
MKNKTFGLIGRNISYSFSAGYFKEKFEQMGVGHTYRNFDIDDIEEFRHIKTNTKGLKGLNVTIPYKEEVIPLLDSLSKKAKVIGAVNTITISKKGKTKGHNTDWFGFKKALKPLLKKRHKKALILGTGGASKAVAFALRDLKIEYDFVSREGNEYLLSYAELNREVFDDYQIIINTTPLGTFPNVNECPPIDYSLFTKDHIAFDLVYNPAETLFLKKAKENGAKIKNGYDMLVYQAEKAWAIWNK